MYPGAHAETIPDKPAYIMAKTGQVVTYRELNDRSNQLAQLLRQRGLQHGDSVAICMENNDTYFVATWAGQRAGLYYTAMSSRLTPDEVTYILNDCGAKAFITSIDKRDVAMAVRDTAPNVHTWLMIGGTTDGYESFEEVVGAMPTEPIADEAEGRDMLYSSGTTGRPKGVKAPLTLQPMGQNAGLGGLGRMLY